MNAFRCLRVVARPAASPSTLFRSQISVTQPKSAALQYRSISLLTPRRPMLARTSLSSTLPAPGTSSTLLASAPETLDLAGKISAHPGLGSMQIRCGPRDTYNPSHLVRKRRHGFLTRLRSKKGRKLLMRRLKKGRWNLSH